MDESGGKPESQKERYPRRSPQLGRDCAEDTVSVVSAVLSVRFDFKERQQNHRQGHQQNQNRPWPNIYIMKCATNQSTVVGSFFVRRLGSKSGRENPMLRSPDDKKEKQTARPKRNSDH